MRRANETSGQKFGKSCLALAVAGMVIFAATGCKSVPPPTPISELNSQQNHGRLVFQSRCGACHYDRTGDALHGPSLMGIYKKEYLPSGAPANDERVRNTILRGRVMMPAMGGTMTPAELDDLVAYLHTL